MRGGGPTRPGALPGTPAGKRPERKHGHYLDARSEQGSSVLLRPGPRQGRLGQSVVAEAGCPRHPLERRPAARGADSQERGEVKGTTNASATFFALPPCDSRLVSP